LRPSLPVKTPAGQRVFERKSLRGVCNPAAPALDNRAGSHRNLAADAIAFQRCANRISDRLSCGKCETKTPCGIQFWRRDFYLFLTDVAMLQLRFNDHLALAC